MGRRGKYLFSPLRAAYALQHLARRLIFSFCSNDYFIFSFVFLFCFHSYLLSRDHYTDSLVPFVTVTAHHVSKTNDVGLSCFVLRFSLYLFERKSTAKILIVNGYKLENFLPKEFLCGLFLFAFAVQWLHTITLTALFN